LSNKYSQSSNLNSLINENDRTDTYYKKYSKLVDNVCTAISNTADTQKITFVSLLRELEPLRYFREKGCSISKTLWRDSKQFMDKERHNLGKLIKPKVGRPTKITNELLSTLKFFLKGREITRVSPNLIRSGKKIRYLESGIGATHHKFLESSIYRVSEPLFRKILKKHFPYVLLYYFNLTGKETFQKNGCLSYLLPQIEI
jgi:hypothetical protein